MMQKKDTNLVHLTPRMTPSQIHTALREVEMQYAQNTQTYIEGLQQYTFEIKKCKDELDALRTDVQKRETALRPIEYEIYYQQRQLEKLNEAFTQKVHHLEETEEYTDNNTQNHLLEKQKKELSHLLDEIEEGESILLEHELQRLNTLSVIEPLHRQINQLDAQLKELTLQKEQYETTKISQISIFPLPQEEKPELVDIDVIDEDVDKNIAEP